MKLHEAMEEVLSSHTLAVIPLAILMAISPFNSSAQEKKLVRSQDFNLEKGVLKLEYYDHNGDYADIERITVELDLTRKKQPTSFLEVIYSSGFIYYDFHDIMGGIKSINKCNYNVVGDDGVSVGTWTVPYVTLDGPEDAGKYLMRPDIVEAIEKFANSKENNGAVEIRNIDRNLKIGYSTISTIGDVHKFNVKYDNPPKKLGEKLEEFNLETSIDKYNLALYESGDFVVERLSDGLKGIVEKARELDVIIVSPDYYNKEQAQIGCIDLKWSETSKFTILEPGLYSSLLKIKKEYPEIGKAYETTTEEYQVTLTPTGYMPKY